MAKKDPYTKVKSMIVSSRSFLGRKTEMEKQIEKYEGQGWTLTHKRKVRGKESHELTFEYKMSDDEIAALKKRQRMGGIGCVAIVAVFLIIGAIGSSQQNASIAATKTFEGTQVAYANATSAQQAIYDTATATLWTPTYTPTPTDTPTITPTPTITYTPSITFTPSITPTPAPSATITDTPLPSATVPTDAPPITYYVRSLANARLCEKTSCDVIVQLQAGTTIQVVGVVQGDAVKGDTSWVRIYVNGQTAYIHSSLVSTDPLPTAAPKPVVVQQQPIQPQPGLVSTIPPNPVVSFVPNCSGDVYNCDSLTCSEIRIYAASCPGDPSDLDHNKDNRYCESQCG